ncbi:YlbF family regulator [Carnobacterium gallinarum]|uniref:YlbF family regulator n=1 Tax=Carnobacterium gallinarum TaxID=2749 RepID=UPI0005571DCA|nr:YlbF family regulator [Carnobacterium gallinarum]
MKPSEESQLDAVTKHQLDRLIERLEANEVIQNYQLIEEKAQNHPRLNQLIAEIKVKQKEAVAFNHYGKPEAEKTASQEAADLTNEFNQHIVVTSYQDALVEANDLLQHLVGTVQEELVDQITDKLEQSREE